MILQYKILYDLLPIARGLLSLRLHVDNSYSYILFLRSRPHKVHLSHRNGYMYLEIVISVSKTDSNLEDSCLEKKANVTTATACTHAVMPSRRLMTRCIFVQKNGSDSVAFDASFG